VNRGRPPYDDVLTPREWQVLALIREGLTNEAIAAQLAIAPDTVKFHVSQILSKVGVASRQEAARWEGQPKRSAWLAFFLKPYVLATVASAAAVLVLVLCLTVLSGADPRPEGQALTEGALDDFQLPPAPTTEAQAPERSEIADLRITVCIDDHVWQRPTLEEQAANINGDNRYMPFDELKQSQFAALFWVGAGPATGRPNPFGKLVEFSGLWTLDKQGLLRELTQACPDEPNIYHLEVVDVWLLGYAATSARWERDRTVIQVAARLAGFEVVQLRYPGPVREYAGTVEFVDASGKVLGRIEGDASWSKEP